jgi:maleate isomerase
LQHRYKQAHLMDGTAREYGRGGWIGIGVPQANPTVEAEFRRMLPDDTEMMVVRLQNDEASSEQRLVRYLEMLPDTLRRFGSLRPDVFGFGNTGSSYLIEPEREVEIINAIRQEFGFPVITASAALIAAAQDINASTIAIVSPFPRNITEAAVNFYEAQGLKVSTVETIDIGSPDTRDIYNVDSRDTVMLLRDLPMASIDAVLLIGSGMPSLRAIRQGALLFDTPVLSSNYCLAWALLRSLGKAGPPWSDQGPTLSLL